MVSKCPFSGNSGGQCPFSGASPSQTQANATSTVENRLTPSLERSFLESGGGARSAPTTGRVLGNFLQRTLDELLEEDPDLCCPVSLMVFREPVRASDGFIYEKAMLAQLLKNKQRSPMTREVLKSEYKAANDKMGEVLQFRHHRSDDLIKFALQAAGQQAQIATTALERATDYITGLNTTQAPSLACEAARVYAMLGRRLPVALEQIRRS